MSIVIIDYGVGNVKSIINAFKVNGKDVKLSNDKNEILNSDGIVLPGVGAFAKAMENLEKLELVSIIREYCKLNKPILGICLGMQMLMEESEEFGLNKGLGLIKGTVKKFSFNSNQKVKLPHISWSKINISKTEWQNTILEGVDSKSSFYFVHSYIVHPKNSNNILSTTEYSGLEFCSSIKKGNIYGCQFHPEKSSKDGLFIINNFIKICKK